MIKNRLLVLAALFLLAGCVSEVIRINDDRYLKPGALDAPLTGYYDVYQYKFLDKYRVTHDWLRIGNCSYRKLQTLNRPDAFRGDIYAVRDIYEENGKTWQRFDPPLKPYDFDHFVRSLKETVPVMEAGKQVGTRERENGLSTMCFESWAGTSHSLVLRLHKRDLSTWRTLWSQYNPAGRWSEQQVGNNKWYVLQNQEIDLDASGKSGGWFQSWLLPIGDTGYTIGMQLGATQQSLKIPKAHAQFQTIFRHLIESVKIEALTPQIQAELAQNAQKAQAIQLNDCQKIVVKEKLSPKHWCRPVLGLPYPQK
jgi:hypothetical protein